MKKKTMEILYAICKHTHAHMSNCFWPNVGQDNISPYFKRIFSEHFKHHHLYYLKRGIVIPELSLSSFLVLVFIWALCSIMFDEYSMIFNWIENKKNGPRFIVLKVKVYKGRIWYFVNKFNSHYLTQCAYDSLWLAKGFKMGTKYMKNIGDTSKRDRKMKQESPQSTMDERVIDVICKFRKPLFKSTATNLDAYRMRATFIQY